VSRLAGGLIIAILVALVLPTARAHAEPQAEQEARAMFKKANHLLETGEFQKALDLYREAYARFPSPKILINMGTALRSLGKDVEAAATYERYLGDPGADPKRRDEVKQLLDELSAKHGRLRVDIDQPGAQLQLDGQAVELPASRVLHVPPGTHALTAKKEAQQVTASVQVAAGEERTVELRFAPAKIDTSLHAVPESNPALTATGNKEHAWRPPAWSPWVAGGVAVVAVAFGAYFGARTLDRSVSDNDADSAATGANVSFIAAGAAAVGAGGLWYWRSREAR
jgi:hypothetical protein